METKKCNADNLFRSFIIAKRCLTRNQVFAIRHHGEVCHRLYMPCPEQVWAVDENDCYIGCHTSASNLDLKHFLAMLDIPEKNILSSSSEESMLNYGEELEIQMQHETDIPMWEQAVNDIKNSMSFDV